MNPEFRADFQRQSRCGFPEFIFGQGKTVEQLTDIFKSFMGKDLPVMATRVSSNDAHAVQALLPQLQYNSLAKTLSAGNLPTPIYGSNVLVVTAGTTDLPVAHEALATLAFQGVKAELLTDVGVAGIHRILAESERLRQASVIVVVAGMDGALPSVVGGLVAVPVIAVPTSVGYGAAFSGLAPLLTMLNSCASGVTVVNIDNGFGAACAAIRILNSTKG